MNYILISGEKEGDTKLEVITKPFPFSVSLKSIFTDGIYTDIQLKCQLMQLMATFISNGFDHKDTSVVAGEIPVIAFTA
jgi:hypothetical protein